jgi:hypothetical protein
MIRRHDEEIAEEVRRGEHDDREAPLTMSVFRPTVCVDDDGVVTIDWFDSYEDTVTVDGSDPAHALDGQEHSALLDHILGAPDLPEHVRLARLAEHMEANP